MLGLRKCLLDSLGRYHQSRVQSGQLRPLEDLRATAAVPTPRRKGCRPDAARPVAAVNEVASGTDFVDLPRDVLPPIRIATTMRRGPTTNRFWVDGGNPGETDPSKGSAPLWKTARCEGNTAGVRRSSYWPNNGISGLFGHFTGWFNL